MAGEQFQVCPICLMPASGSFWMLLNFVSLWKIAHVVHLQVKCKVRPFRGTRGSWKFKSSFFLTYNSFCLLFSFYYSDNMHLMHCLKV